MVNNTTSFRRPLSGNNIFDMNLTANIVYGHQLSDSFTTAVIIYFVALIASGIVSNLILIWLIVCRRNLHSVTNTFIINLAICDFIIASINIPQDVDFLIRGYYNGNVITCGFKEIVFFFSLPSSVANLLLLTVERFCKVVYTYKYRAMFTRRRVNRLIAAVWCYTLLVALFPILYDHNSINVKNGACWMEFPWPYIYYTVAANFILPVLLIFGLNIALFIVAKRHAVNIQLQLTGKVNRGSRRTKFRNWFSFLANFKAVKTILLLVGVFLFCWMSFIAIATHNLLCNLCHPRELTWLANCINYSFTALNPILYGITNKTLRKEIRNMFCSSHSTSRKRFYRQDSMMRSCTNSEVCERHNLTAL